MRILWGSNSPTSPSGYGVQTDLFTRRLKADGHEVAIASNYGLDEGMMNWPTEAGDIPIYPKSGDRFSRDILVHHAQHFQADVILTHYDSWVYDPALMAGRWVPWYPMDTEEYPAAMAEKVSQALMSITQTRDAVAKAAMVGIESEYVPAAFDGSVYFPRDRMEWRNEHSIPEDRFVVGVVAANRGDPGAPSRKSFPQIMEAFAALRRTVPDALLYLHTITDAAEGAHCDLGYFTKRYDLPEGSVAKANPYALRCGHYDGEAMAQIYSGIDVLLNPSMGEGFGVPVLEAQACGTPVIVGDWTAMKEVARSGAMIGKEDAARYPIVAYGDQWLVRAGAVFTKLVEALDWPHDEETARRIAESVQEYEVDTVYEQNWKPVLEKLKPKVEELNEAARMNLKAQEATMNRAQRRAEMRKKKRLSGKGQEVAA